MTDFFAMGGYGYYVWSAYAVFFTLLLVDAIVPALRNRQARQDLYNRYQRELTRKAHTKP